jgi:CheY-like chemotaxis protein
MPLRETPPPGRATAATGSPDLRPDVLAIRDAIVNALDPGTGDVPPRKLALLREALRRCNALAAKAGIDPGEAVVSAASARDFKGFILAGRQAARAGLHPVTVLMLRPGAPAAAAPPLTRVLAIAQRQLRATGDIARLLDGEQVLAITLESDRAGGLAALRRIARAIGEDGLAVTAFDYSLTELGPDSEEGGAVRRVGEGFRPLSLDPERITPKRVLALDDDPTVLAVIVEQLESCGHGLDVEWTTSGFEACVRFGEFEPDLVILDIRMPEIDGRDALSVMKRAAGPRDVKFIVASAMPEHFAEMRERGCDACLQKPFDLDELTGTVARLLDLDETPLRRAA